MARGNCARKLPPYKSASLAVLLGGKSRPCEYSSAIESAMETNRLVPSRLTCEQCHWPQKFDAVKLRVIFHFKDDANNTQTQTALMMLTGGGDLGGLPGKAFRPGAEIHYATSAPARQAIPW